MKSVDIEIEESKERSEFAVFVNDDRVFSRLEQRRFPEADELVGICRELAAA